MKNLLKTVRDSIAAAMAGRTIEQMEDEQRQQDVTNAVDRFLESNPDWKPTTAKTAQAVTPVRDTKHKSKRIMKALGAGAGMFTPHEIDSDILERAREKCRQLVADNPDRYGDIITAAPIRGT
ncbi:MAG: hypothetical protein SOI28_21220 [Rahnella inusitata]|jgi:hypothetical protein